MPLGASPLPQQASIQASMGMVLFSGRSVSCTTLLSVSSQQYSTMSLWIITEPLVPQASMT